MSQRRSMTLAIVLAFLAAAWVWYTPNTSEEPIALIPGRNNTVLFLTSEANGLSNVHVATTFALVENHPDVEIHYASFPQLEKKIKRISDAARANTPSARPVVWHEIPGASVGQTFWRIFGNSNGLIEQPGMWGMQKKVDDLSALLTTWTAEEHWTIYKHLLDLIEQVDPSLVVIDQVFKPATDLTTNVNRRFLTISPNSLVDMIDDQQPWGGMFWKYPAIASGYPFPMPWHLIPSNIYIQLRVILSILTIPRTATIRAFLEERGVKNPMAFGLLPKRTQLLAMTVPEVNLPMDYIPPEISFYGPIVLETAPAEQQDAELMRWLAGSPGDAGKTILVNLGSIFRFKEQKARELAEALARVLDQVKYVKIVWKFHKEGKYDEQQALAPLKDFIENGRARVVQWLNVDPAALLASGHIDLFVNHGGGNSFHEGIFAGVPQVLLPMWFDCYNFAGTAEYLGIGLWPGKGTAPAWDVKTVADGIVEGLVGAKSQGMRERSQELSSISKSYGGRNAAAKEIARLAAL